MSGCFKNFLKPFIGLFFFLGLSSQAHVPEPGQIARFQPSLLRKEKAFSSTGKVLSHGKSMNTQLRWFGPGKYEVQVDGVPAIFYRTTQGAGSWTLSRNGKDCILKTPAVTVACPPPGFWAMLELSGQPDATARSLNEAGIYNNNDVVWKETDGRVAKDTPNSRVEPTVGQNGDTPIAVLQVKGPNAREDDPEAFPLIQFDPTFLTPVMARWMVNNEIINVKAVSDLDVRRGRSRFTFVLSDIVNVEGPYGLYARFTRSEPKALSNRSKRALAKAQAPIRQLEDLLSPEGQHFLMALLSTH